MKTWKHYEEVDTRGRVTHELDRDGRPGVVVMALCLLALCGGCDTPVPATDAPVDGGEESGLDLVVLDAAGNPVSGALIAVDVLGGSRRETASDVTGGAQLDIDWSLGPIDLIAYSAENGAEAYVALDEGRYDALRAGGPLRITLPRRTASPTITVRGTVRGLLDPSHHVYVFSSASRGEAFTTDFSIRVPAGEPFALFVVEVTDSSAGTSTAQTVHRMVRTETFPGGVVDLTVDVDLAALPLLTPTAVSGSFTPPVRAPGSFYDIATRWVGVTASNFGAVFSVVESLTDAGDYRVAYSVPTEETNPLTVYDFYAADGRAFDLFEFGPPVAGARDIPFFEPPTIEEPAGTFLRVFEEVRFNNDAPATAEVAYRIFGDGGTRAFVRAPNGASRVRLPALPTGSDTVPFFEGGLGGYINLCVPSPPTERYACRIQGQSNRVALDP